MKSRQKADICEQKINRGSDSTLMPIRMYKAFSHIQT